MRSLSLEQEVIIWHERYKDKAKSVEAGLTASPKEVVLNAIIRKADF